jgi:hypothetical protein
MPGDPHFQYNLAVVLALMERYDEARAVARKLQTSGDPETVSVAGKFLTQLDQAQQYAAYKRMNESNSAAATVINHEAQSSAESSAPVLRRKTQTAANSTVEDTAPTAATDAPLAAAGPRAYSMVGTITDVNCASTPQMRMTLKAQTIVMHLHSGDFSQVAVKSGGTNSAAKIVACTSLRGRNAHVSYRLVSEKDWDGEIVSIEFRDAP